MRVNDVDFFLDKTAWYVKKLLQNDPHNINFKEERQIYIIS